MAGTGTKRLGDSAAAAEFPPTMCTSLTPRLQRALRGFEFQDHATGHHSRVDQAIHLFAGDGGKNFFSIQHAGHIRQINQMIGFDEFGAGSGHVIGIDVIELVVRAKSEASGHGHEFCLPQRFQKTHIDAGEVADKTEPALHIVVHQR